jgi:hypothetical protein
MMAKGRDVSDLFPPVVKNVAAKNLEVKKLVYVYLVRYAEEQQDLALLSISTFQRALKVGCYTRYASFTNAPGTGSQSTDSCQRPARAQFDTRAHDRTDSHAGHQGVYT